MRTPQPLSEEEIERAKGLLDVPERRWFLERYLNALKRGGELPGRVSLREPTIEQRESLNRLLGKRLKGRSLSLKLPDLRQILGTFEMPLEELLDVLFGPLRDGDRERQERLYQEGLDQLIEDEKTDDVRKWLDDLRSTGLPKALVAEREEAWEFVLLAHKIVERLPTEGVTLAELATEFTGDAHALDRGRPLGTLVFRFAAGLAGMTHTSTALQRRMAWLKAGVLVDEVSSSVLTHNLAVKPTNFLGLMIELHRKNNEPCRISLRQLVGYPLRIRPSVVYICENPTVLSVATDKVGRRCPTLVCTEGMPASAVLYLLDLLSDADCDLHFHGDFDWGGVKIGNLLRERFPALQMWRMSTSDYLGLEKGRALEGTPVEAVWDPQLAEEMTRRGLAFHEEGHLDKLLSDLHEKKKKKKKSTKKKNRNLGPRRTRFKREQRLQSFKRDQYTGSGGIRGLVRHYAKYFGVDRVTAALELRMLDFTVPEEHLESLKKGAERRGCERRARRQKREKDEDAWVDLELDEHGLGLDELALSDDLTFEDDIPF